MEITEEELKRQNSSIAKIILKILLVFFILFVCFCGYMLYRIKQELTPKKYTNQEEVLKHIETDYVLKKHWETIQTFTQNGSIESMESITQVLMGGACFYVKCRFTDKEIKNIKTQLSSKPQETISNKKYSGTKYILEKLGHDGARLSIIIDDKDSGIVHFDSYAGDG